MSVSPTLEPRLENLDGVTRTRALSGIDDLDTFEFRADARRLSPLADGTNRDRKILSGIGAISITQFRNETRPTCLAPGRFHTAIGQS